MVASSWLVCTVATVMVNVDSSLSSGLLCIARAPAVASDVRWVVNVLQAPLSHSAMTRTGQLPAECWTRLNASSRSGRPDRHRKLEKRTAKMLDCRYWNHSRTGTKVLVVVSALGPDSSRPSPADQTKLSSGAETGDTVPIVIAFLQCRSRSAQCLYDEQRDVDSRRCVWRTAWRSRWWIRRWRGW